MFRRHPHRGYHAVLEIDVIFKPAQIHRENRADQPQRNDEHHRERDRPAFVERREAKEDDEQRQAVKQRGLPRGEAFLIGGARPGDAGDRKSTRMNSSNQCANRMPYFALKNKKTKKDNIQTQLNVQTLQRTTARQTITKTKTI